MNPLIAAIAVPSVLIVVGMFFNWQEARSIRADMKSGFSEVNSRIDQLSSQVNKRVDEVMSHLITFYNITGKLEGRVDEISKKG
jgi:hypothetical protein